MRFLFIILSIILALNVNAQSGRGMFFAGSPIAALQSSFNWDNLQAQSPTSYSNAGTVVIENKSFTNLNTSVLSGNDISISGTGNLTFRNCYFGPSIRKGAAIENFTGTARFINCLFASNEGGVEFSSSTGNLQIDSSQCINPWGQPRCKGQFVQFSFVTTSNSYITNCSMESFRGEGNTEDWISLYASSGISGSPIRLANNKARGGGPSNSGGGFMTGDTGGGWQLVEGNKLMNVGNYMYAASGGDNIIIRNNFGYQQSYPWTNIAMYAYGGQQGASCSNITVMGNSVWISNGNSWYAGDGSPEESCGIIIGANPWFDQTNLDDLTLSQLAFPTTIITFVDADRLWHIRDESTQFTSQTGSCFNTAQLPRPTSNAGADQSINISTATLSGSGSSSTDGYNYQWVIVSGPNTPTMSASTSVTNNLSGLIDGTYQFRLQVCNNSGACDADWMDIVVNLP
jgi:hypothetical protein